MWFLNLIRHCHLASYLLPRRVESITSTTTPHGQSRRTNGDSCRLRLDMGYALSLDMPCTSHGATVPCFLMCTEAGPAQRLRLQYLYIGSDELSKICCAKLAHGTTGAKFHVRSHNNGQEYIPHASSLKYKNYAMLSSELLCVRSLKQHSRNLVYA
jgi:hypothetical protein